MVDRERLEGVPEALRAEGGLLEGVTRRVSEATGVPEASVFGIGTFYNLIRDPEPRLRICQGLSCKLRGAGELLEQAHAAGLPASPCSCLAACDRPVAILKNGDPMTGVTEADLRAAGGEWCAVNPVNPGSCNVGPEGVGAERLAVGLLGAVSYGGRALARARSLGPARVVELLADAGLDGRGGAGFLAARKWSSVLAQSDPVRTVILNADEGESGTFKDREVLLRRPDRVVEGLAIAAVTVGASDVYCYLRGELTEPRRSLEEAITRAGEAGLLVGLRFHVHSGFGAYVCGEETALIESLEGKRGMPRIKPPFPTERGFRGKPTLVHNVETIACVPAILERGGDWFRGLGRTSPGTRLYSVSGHVARPGVYEMPSGICLDDLFVAAGGCTGTLRAFSPGGASSGFLPASERTRPLDGPSLAAVGSMVGSAAVLVLDDTVDMAEAARHQLAFFEEESCGQCAPCRIGTRLLREAVDRYIATRSPSALDLVDDVAWQMDEGSICALGRCAPLPLTSALRWFPEDFAR